MIDGQLIDWRFINCLPRDEIKYMTNWGLGLIRCNIIFSSSRYLSVWLKSEKNCLLKIFLVKFKDKDVVCFSIIKTVDLKLFYILCYFTIINPLETFLSFFTIEEVKWRVGLSHNLFRCTQLTTLYTVQHYTLYTLGMNFFSPFKPEREFKVYKSCKCLQIICSRVH